MCKYSKVLLNLIQIIEKYCLYNYFLLFLLAYIIVKYYLCIRIKEHNVKPTNKKHYEYNKKKSVIRDYEPCMAVRKA